VRVIFRYIIPAIFVVAGTLYAIDAAVQNSSGSIIAGIVVALLGVAFFFVMKFTTRDLG
jgi:ABC-type Fe3+-siderophore transport system permease subunit